ncbi:MAG: Exodeoxyribonuclease [Ferruginibacter sp.]|nr:Exodeoxyribonuclease [Ferruginibacter sp.]
MPDRFEQFNAASVSLSGSNLIEASAGTGKTYSIAILVLRLILEKKFTIREILMVTFTKAAVAELEERVRLFIRTAAQAAKEEAIEDETIRTLVAKAVATEGRDEVKRLLKEAMIFLDETAVLTIHSFCQQTLTEFAFETNQLFGAELLLDTSAIIENEVNKFWRRYITSVPVNLLALLGRRLSRDDIASVVKNHLDGKRYHEYEPGATYVLGAGFYEGIIPALEELKKRSEELEASILGYISSNRDKILADTQTNSYAKKSFLHLVVDPPEFLATIRDKKAKKTGYIEKIYKEIVEKCTDCEKLEEEKNNKLQHALNQLYYAAIKEVAAAVKAHKLLHNQVSFDDLIANLHNALVKRENRQLVAALQHKYKAVFIDEFQDTDRLQYEIFKEAFGKNTVLFYIGDPKQSIYAWRKADIATYFRAYEDVDFKYGMNENFRSSALLIGAMNQFFLPTADFDSFYFPPGEASIKYIPVNSPAVNRKDELRFHSNPVIPIAISTCSNKDAIANALVANIAELLRNDGYTLPLNDSRRRIKPSDIGILVRSNKEGNTIKYQLAKHGIPAITIGDAKLLESEEAIAVLYLLEAMVDTSRSSINRALLGSFTGFSIREILILDDETAIQFFKEYKEAWDADGIYTALMKFITDFSVQKVLLESGIENGERIITNLYQMVELLYKIQTTKKLSPLELIDWLKRGIERNDAAGDEYEQRIENDEECVKIVTIHKSKGLEYNIVFAPYLDFMERKKELFCNYRNAAGDYITVRKDQMSNEDLALYQRQNEQENRRLLYVAITRAVYKCFIYRNKAKAASTLSIFADALKGADPALIGFTGPADLEKDFRYRAEIKAAKTVKVPEPQFELLHKNWSRMSYTMLAAILEKPAKLSSGIRGNEYDEFIFRQLEKGSKSGNLLHYIFETLNFSRPERWADTISQAIQRFAAGSRNLYETWLPELVAHVMDTEITIGNVSFRLNEVGFEKRIHEFEFDFPVALFQPAMLEELSQELQTINVKERFNLEGMMNGKIDMFFECKGKYFVLDWKSTYLGDRLEDYDQASVGLAMNEHNYHLQYLIYTLATKKYLESRLPGFDYERDFGGVIYLFVRGIRRDLPNGIFTAKPRLAQIELLEEMFSVKN